MEITVLEKCECGEFESASSGDKEVYWVSSANVVFFENDLPSYCPFCKTKMNKDGTAVFYMNLSTKDATRADKVQWSELKRFRFVNQAYLKLLYYPAEVR